MDTRDYIKSVFIVTHPHKIQLTTKINLSMYQKLYLSLFKIKTSFITSILKDLKNEEIYENFHDIWKEDHVHLKEKNYNLFLKRLIKSVNEKIY